MPKTDKELTVEECLVVDRKRKRYAFFLEDEQQGNWMSYTDDQEPERIARQYDVHIKESQQ